MVVLNSKTTLPGNKIIQMNEQGPLFWVAINQYKRMKGKIITQNDLHSVHEGNKNKAIELGLNSFLGKVTNNTVMSDERTTRLHTNMNSSEETKWKLKKYKKIKQGTTQTTPSIEQYGIMEIALDQCQLKKCLVAELQDLFIYESPHTT